MNVIGHGPQNEPNFFPIRLHYGSTLSAGTIQNYKSQIN
jgi:hypothetical protein